jgi:hypothetical protein
MSEDDIRDDGTVVCQVHGLRYDPSVSTGCIRCPHKSVPAPKKKSSAAPPMTGGMGDIELDASALPPSHAGGTGPGGPPARRSWVPGANLAQSGSQPPPASKRPSLLAPEGASAAHLKPPSTIYISKRTFLIGLLAVGGGVAYGVKRFLATAAQDVADRITPIKFPSGVKESTGTVFMPAAAATGKVPLLAVFDWPNRSRDAVARYAYLAEKHGWAVAGSDAYSKGISPDDTSEIEALIAHVKANYPIEDGRVFVAGGDVAGSNAYRAALLKSDIIAGAIVEIADDDVWREIGSIAGGDLSFYLFARTSDTSISAMHVLRDEMPRRGFKVVYVEEVGGRTPMTRDELESAMAWLDAVRAGG